jgi:hypothetical protein
MISITEVVMTTWSTKSTTILKINHYQYQPTNMTTTLKGKILHTSWGYDMTINEYAVIIDATEKTVLCKMLSMKVKDDYGKGTGRATPLLKEQADAKPFRLRIKNWNGGEMYFKGSYPFSGDSKRMDCFSVWNGQANYHNTWD